MRLAIVLAAAAALIWCPAPARALCSYNNVLNARTTLPQEFRDSRWVVRVRVLSARSNWGRRAVHQGSELPWTLYRLQVLRSYKGRSPGSLTFFTERNSGGFYMDRPYTGPDIGGEYLLFLNPMPSHPELPAEARRAVFVNYSCGQSRAWREVSGAERRQLARLGRVRR